MFFVSKENLSDFYCYVSNYIIKKKKKKKKKYNKQTLIVRHRESSKHGESNITYIWMQIC